MKYCRKEYPWTPNTSLPLLNSSLLLPCMMYEYFLALQTSITVSLRDTHASLLPWPTFWKPRKTPSSDGNQTNNWSTTSSRHDSPLLPSHVTLILTYLFVCMPMHLTSRFLVFLASSMMTSSGIPLPTGHRSASPQKLTTISMTKSFSQSWTAWSIGNTI